MRGFRVAVLLGVLLLLPSLVVAGSLPESAGARPAVRAGAWLAFHADPGGSGDLYLDSVNGRHRRRLTRLFGQGPTATWSPDGSHLAFLARPQGIQDVYVIAANGHGLRRLTHGEGDHFGNVSWSPNGREIAFTCCGTEAESIYLIKPDGSGRRRLTEGGEPVWSPDGQRIAFFSAKDGNPEIYSIKPDGTDLDRLTSNPAEDDDPAWSSDSQRIAFTSKRDGHAQIYVMNAEGSGQRRLVRDRWSDQRPSWSPTGGRIVFTSFRNRDPNLLGIGNAEILVASAKGSRVRNLTHSRAWEGEPSWAPNGRRIAYAVRRNFGPKGVFRVGVMNADGSGERLLPPVTDPGTASGQANSCCVAWQP
jgi:Tol biopolymer transport system component